MKIPGRVQNGVVVLEGEAALPNGTPVIVSCTSKRIRQKRDKKNRITFPLVRSKHPGSLNLTNERIAEILQEEDLSSVQQPSKRLKK